jgi:Fe-S cluster biosynthesis and repair protein YggX
MHLRPRGTPFQYLARLSSLGRDYTFGWAILKVEIPRRFVMATTTGAERSVFCVKLHKELPGLDEVPFDGHPLGQRIYDNVSKDAWKMWVEQMKMIMNEYRLNLGTPEAQEFLLKQMEEYFFGEGAAHPPGYVAPGH